jgi:hypothetical protein
LNTLQHVLNLLARAREMWEDETREQRAAVCGTLSTCKTDVITYFIPFSDVTQPTRPLPLRLRDDDAFIIVGEEQHQWGLPRTRIHAFSSLCVGRRPTARVEWNVGSFVEASRPICALLCFLYFLRFSFTVFLFPFLFLLSAFFFISSFYLPLCLPVSWCSVERTASLLSSAVALSVGAKLQDSIKGLFK